MFNGVVLKKYLLNSGVSKVGYAKVNVDDFPDFKYAISLVMKLPKKAIQSLIDDAVSSVFDWGSG